MASFLQSVSVIHAAAGTTTALAWTTQNMTAGSFCWCVCAWNDQTSSCTLSDPTNGSWTALGSPLLGAGGLSAWSSQLFYLANNVSTAKPTVTMTTSGSNAERDMAMHEYSFAGAGGAIEGAAAYSDPSGTTPSSSSVTPAASSDFCFAYNFNSGSVTTTNSPFTLRESTNFGSNSTCDDLAPVGGTPEHASWVTVGSDSMVGIAVASLPAGIALAQIQVVDFAVARSTSY